MAVNVKNEQNIIKIDIDLINSLIGDLLSILNFIEEDVNIVIVNNKRISELNKKYLGKEEPTDVLAFSMKEGKNDFVIKDEILGDVAVSAEMAYKRSKTLNIGLHKELILYIIHGILHLLGYEDYSGSSRKEMKMKEKELLSQLDI